MSSEHYSKKFMPPKENKTAYERIDKKLPEIISHYNQNKGDVDTVDHLISMYSCRRKTNRWTMSCLFYILDVVASHSFILFALDKNKKNETLVNDLQRQRRTSLKTLSMSLITGTIESRVVKLGEKNFKHIKSDVQESFKRSLNLDDLSDFKTPPKKS